MGCRVFSIILAIEQRDSYKAFLKLCLVSQADQSIWEQLRFTKFDLQRSVLALGSTQ